MMKFSYDVKLQSNKDVIRTKDVDLYREKMNFETNGAPYLWGGGLRGETVKDWTSVA